MRSMIRKQRINYPAPSSFQRLPASPRRDSMSMMMAPSPVSNGTGLFIGAAAVVIIWFYSFSRGGYVSKDNFQIISVITIVLTVAMWILWLCAWMHQWHPLIYPEWRFEAAPTTDAAEGKRYKF